jgi:hypothetical protein
MKNTFNFKIIEKYYVKNVLCMTKDSNNIMKWCQIYGVQLHEYINTITKDE